MSEQGTKQYQPIKVSKAAYAGAAGYVFVILSWLGIYEALYLYIQATFSYYALIQQVGGVLALCISVAYVTTGWHVVDSFYKSRREGVDHYPYKLDILLSEDGKFANGNMLVAEDGIIPFAVFNKDLKVIARITKNRTAQMQQLLQAADTRQIGEESDKEIVNAIQNLDKTGPKPEDTMPAFIGYMIVPNPEFELFDVLVIAIPVSFARLMGSFLLKEFPYRGLLVFRPVAPISLVKVHRLFDTKNRSILVSEVGWSAYHAEMMAMNLKVNSISNLDKVKITVPIHDPTQNLVVMKEIEVPAATAIFTAMDNWQAPKLQETIASRDSTIEALKGRTGSVKEQAGRMSAEDDQLLKDATGGGNGFHPLAAIKRHKKASTLVGSLVIITIAVAILTLAGIKI